MNFTSVNHLNGTCDIKDTRFDDLIKPTAFPIPLIKQLVYGGKKICLIFIKGQSPEPKILRMQAQCNFLLIIVVVIYYTLFNCKSFFQA